MRILFCTLLFSTSLAFSQVTRKVCFLGNSYTYTNDLPGLIGNMANADGNTLIKDQNTPGGYTLEGHSTNTTSLAKIDANSWDYVVLQEQSQLPSFGWTQVQAEVFPFAEILCDSIRSANPCAVPVFFDTWGRQNGDPQWDSIDTFTEMNQRLYNAYEYMAETNSGILSPVGIAYEHVANDMSAAVPFASLYSGDGSHPQIYGSYLAACVFYELLFQTTSVGNTYLPVGITGPQASYLQGVAHHVLTAVDSIETTAFISPQADFSSTITGLTADFTNTSVHAFSYEWDFGDGTTSTETNPSHTYGTNGAYTVSLTAYYCDSSSVTTQLINTNDLGFNTTETDPITVYPNPSMTGNFTLGGLNGDDFIQVFSLDGKLVLTLSQPNPTETIQLPAGSYLLKTKTSSIKLLVLNY